MPRRDRLARLALAIKLYVVDARAHPNHISFRAFVPNSPASKLLYFSLSFPSFSFGTKGYLGVVYGGGPQTANRLQAGES